jgi:type VI protein secretion system component VasK
MKNVERGFSALYVLFAVLAVIVIGAAAYGVYHNRHTTTTVTVQKTTFTGPTAAVDSANSQELSSESAADSQSAAIEQTTVTSTNQAASDVGGAYNENSY